MHRILAIPYPIPYPINRTRIWIGLLSDVKNLLPYPIKTDSETVSDGNYPYHFHPDAGLCLRNWGASTKAEVRPYLYRKRNHCETTEYFEKSYPVLS